MWQKKHIYGISTQKMSDGDWRRTGAFPIDEHRAGSEGMISPQFRATFIILRTILDVHFVERRILCCVVNATRFPAGTESLDWRALGAEMT